MSFLRIAFGLISILKVGLHIALISIGIMFIERSSIIESFSNPIILGYRTSKFSYYNLYYGIAFFFLEIIWIFSHRCFLNGQNKGEKVIEIVFDLIYTKTRSKWYFLKGIIPTVIILTLMALVILKSAHIMSGHSAINFFTYYW